MRAPRGRSPQTLHVSLLPPRTRECPPAGVGAGGGVRGAAVRCVRAAERSAAYVGTERCVPLPPYGAVRLRVVAPSAFPGAENAPLKGKRRWSPAGFLPALLRAFVRALPRAERLLRFA